MKTSESLRATKRCLRDGSDSFVKADKERFICCAPAKLALRVTADMVAEQASRERMTP
jgi:hypothetical protein